MTLTLAERQALHGADYVERFDGHDPRRMARLIPELPVTPETHVCDFGCGNALALEHLHGQIASYTGVDFSPEFCAKARQRVARLGARTAEILCGDLVAFCEANPERFDLALAFDFSEHVYDEDWLVFLRAMHASLKPGGKLVIHTPNLGFFVERMKDRDFILKQFPEHIAVRDMRQNVDLLQEAGFKVARQAYLPHYNVLRFLHPLSKLPFLGGPLRARLLIEAERPA